MFDTYDRSERLMRDAIARRTICSRMVRRFAAGLRRLPGLRQPLTWYEERSTEVFIISFPKCGRTWLRLMLGRALARHFQLDYPGLERDMLELWPLFARHPGVPRMRMTHDDDPQWKKTAELTADKSRYRHARVILLVRDPRDVVVSNYFERRKRLALYDTWLRRSAHRLGLDRERIQPYAGEVANFAYEEVGSFTTLLRFYEVWARAQHQFKGFLLVRYEDLHDDAPRELRRIMDFLCLPGVSDVVLADAARYAAFDSMREMERQQTVGSFSLRAADPLDDESYKTRRGRVGGYLDYLAPAEIEYMTRRIEQELDEIHGYRA